MPQSKDAPKGDSTLQERSGKEEAGAVAESRWPSAGAVVAAMALTVLLPDELSRGPTWLLLLVEGVLLVALIVSGPATLTGEETNSASALLSAGSVVWVSNILAFSLLYWELDGGGSAARTHAWPQRRLDLAFPEDLNPHVAPANWLPR